MIIYPAFTSNCICTRAIAGMRLYVRIFSYTVMHRSGWICLKNNLAQTMWKPGITSRDASLLNAHFDLKLSWIWCNTQTVWRFLTNGRLTDMIISITHTSIYINSATYQQPPHERYFCRRRETGARELMRSWVTIHISVDQHRILVFNYKFASLYVGNGEYEKSNWLPAALS